MISIFRSFTSSRRSVSDETHDRIIGLLFEGIAVHMIETDPEDLIRFQRDIRFIGAKLAAVSTSEDQLVATGEAIKAIQEYGRRAQRFTNSQKAELLRIISMLTNTMSSVVAGSSVSLSQLNAIDRKLEQAGGIEDIRVLREQMKECLGVVRDEVSRQREVSIATIAAMEQINKSSEPPKASATSFDPLTGLPGRDQAESELERNIGNKECVAALFVLERLHAINARYGRAIGDDVIQGCAQHISANLPGSPVFRWRGPAILAFVKLYQPSSALQTQLRKVAAFRFEKNVVTDSRSALLRVNTVWMIVPMSEENRTETVLRKLDAFVSAGQLNSA